MNLGDKPQDGNLLLGGLGTPRFGVTTYGAGRFAAPAASSVPQRPASVFASPVFAGVGGGTSGWRRGRSLPR